MSLLDAIILAIVQGLTEFLPVSSSGHLVIVSSLLSGGKAAPLSFDAAVHAGSLLAVLLYFRREIRDMFVALLARIRAPRAATASSEERLILAIIVGTLPVAIIGLAANDAIERAFSSPIFALNMLLVTAGVLVVADIVAASRARSSSWPSMPRALLIGVFQAAALLPGLSRSGSTIAGGLVAGLDRETAMRFSFLLAIPSISGALLFALKDLAETGFADIALFAAGFLTSFVVSLFAIVFLLRTFRQRPFTVFAAYCVVISVIGRFVIR
jgi:undecaprenyl-diphosphatase